MISTKNKRNVWKKTVEIKATKDVKYKFSSGSLKNIELLLVEGKKMEKVGETYNFFKP